MAKGRAYNYKITPAAMERLIELGELGRDAPAIRMTLQSEFGIEVSAAAVRWHLLKHAAEPENVTHVPPVPVEPIVQQRGGHVVRRFTQSEDATLLVLEAEGLSHKAIGERINRAPNSITARLLTLARHDARRERAERNARPARAAAKSQRSARR